MRLVAWLRSQIVARILLYTRNMRTTSKNFLLAIVAGLSMTALITTAHADTQDDADTATATRYTVSNAFVDEIEDGEARVLIDGDSHPYVMPLDMFPVETHEGSRVWIVISH